MDSKCNFIERFKNFIISCDELYLIDAANKGLYKRALKEIDKGAQVEVQFKDDKVICKLSDGTICDLKDDMVNYKCSCPSRTVCKHILISILYIKKNINIMFEKQDLVQKYSNTAKNIDKQFKSENIEEGFREENNKVRDFSWVIDYNIEDIKKKISNKAFKDIVFRLNFGIEVEVKEENFLVVEFKDLGIRVRFTENPSIDKTICTCKEKGFCIHRAEAIIYYKLYKKTLDINALNEAIDIKISKEALNEVKNLIEEITILGLAKLPKSIVDRIETTAVVCHSCDLPRLEKLLRSLSNQLIMYFNKNAAFSRQTVRRLITQIYIIAQAIEKTSSKILCQNLIGEHKTAYTEINPIELVGMGAGAWKSASGYEGITYYFFNEKRKLWMTYTSMKPNYYEGMSININGMYKGRCPWNIEASMENISKVKCKLYNCKLNKNFRISSSEEIRGDIICKTDISSVDFGDKLYDNWRLLIENNKENFKYKLTEENENFNIVLLKIDSWDKSSFDNVNQVFKLPIYDIENNEINIVLRFNKDTKYLIRGLERVGKEGELGDLILGKIYRVEGEYVINPITIYYEDGNIVNLTLD
ncbi:SWIM zinc finger family protein [Clostridium ganghwense]|uniref:SWIM-type domain-containing protein n=1 Tax=Clostridium ganghwense TaxID=312089 RepID=A0ABT4CRL2_9CLOT|nr:SWIM zinc finger family protein [Clostridium ganghwense]MCY6371677.1 hypothetical protein [Clostridium ganghwense]